MAKYAVPSTIREARETLAAVQTDLTEIQMQLNARKAAIAGLDHHEPEWREYVTWRVAAVHALTRKQKDLRHLKSLIRDGSFARPGLPSDPPELLSALRGMCGRWIKEYGICVSADDQALLDAAQAARSRIVETRPLAEANGHE